MRLEDQLAAIESGIGCLALPGGDLLRLTGIDPLLALDRVVSQEVGSLRDGQGRMALLLAPKGQFRALMAVFRAGGEAIVLAPAGRRDELAAVLSGYLRFSRVAVGPMGWEGGSWRVVGPAWPALATDLGADAERAATGCAVAGGPGERLLFLGQTFAGLPGATVAAEGAAARERVEDALRAAGVVELGEPALELARIAAGFPAWGRELTETVLPPEVGLESLAISYTKGCYVGQETIARLKTYGHANRTLVRLRQSAGPDLPPPLPLPLAAAGEEKPRGQLTSCEDHPALGRLGLALVRRELAAPGATLEGAGYAFRVLAPADLGPSSARRP